MPKRIVCLAWLLVLTLGLAGCTRQPVDSATPTEAGGAHLPDQFLGLMNAGKNALSQADATNALAIYREAQALVPNHPDVHLNLANAYLLAGAAEEAIRAAEDVLWLEPNSAAAYFVIGSASLRLAKPEEAVKALENAQKLDPSDTATLFQLGRAKLDLKQYDGAIAAFRQGIALDPNRLHTTAHYLLGQALLRSGRQAEAQQELERHQANFALGSSPVNTATFERSKHTLARVPFKLEQPDPTGVSLKFIESTPATLGDAARRFSGPIGVIDLDHTGWNSLFVHEPGQGFRLLRNTNGIFHPDPAVHPSPAGALFTKMLVGDLQNDRFEDVIVLGEPGCHVFLFGTNGLVKDVSESSRLGHITAIDGALLDLDFTGKLDLAVVTGQTQEVRVFRQFGPLWFSDITSTSGIPASVQPARTVSAEDWNRDGLLDLIVSRQQGAPCLLEKQRGGPLVPSDPPQWPAGGIGCTGDFDNDLRPDLALVSGSQISLRFNGGSSRDIPFSGAAGQRQLLAVDYDNDGWLDLCAVGPRVRLWRNRGLAGFQEQTTQTGLDAFDADAVFEVQFVDFDLDCDSDLIVALEGGGLRCLRNDGGNANSQVRVRLFGNRSNASGLGCKVEIETGTLRLLRTVQRLPVEIGVGKHQTLDSFLVHWFNWPQGEAQVPANCREPILALEMSIQEGSCPYLYAWDGTRFRFVSDILAAAPLGLPVAEGRYTEADPEEYVWIGNDQTFPPRDSRYELQITEELREVLYLDQARLVVVDHEPGTEVHTTDKLLPGKPFPPGVLLTLHEEHPLLRAETIEGQDVTASLQAVDGRRVSPPRVRVPQLRGLAEPHGLTLDFGPLDVRRPLVLVMNGWIRFGGGMANIAASHDPSLPFPFPSLEAEVAGQWEPVDVTVGAPAGKTKTILVDLDGKLKPDTRRLRLTQAFEIHWDRIALLENKSGASTQISFIAPTEADLHFRGFSPLEDFPWDWPLTPNYDIVHPNSVWTVIPGGWCTRYGDVSELVAARDEGLVLVNSGDELTLRFAAEALPPKPDGRRRDFFLYADGWDKDSDFHVAAGAEVEPLPFHGLRDDLYGREQRPSFPSDALHRKYNIRWVESRVLKQHACATTAP